MAEGGQNGPQADAITTLLVPPPPISYNKAGQAPAASQRCEPGV